MLLSIIEMKELLIKYINLFLICVLLLFPLRARAKILLFLFTIKKTILKILSKAKGSVKSEKE